MAADGTITLQVRSLPPGPVGHAKLVYAPSHPQYQAILKHIGGLAPGESRRCRRGARLDDDKIGVGEREPGGKLGKLDRAAATGAVGIERQRARSAVVHDAVLGIGRRNADVEGIGIEHAAGGQPGEDRRLQPAIASSTRQRPERNSPRQANGRTLDRHLGDQVVGAVDGIDVITGVSCHGVVADPAVQDIVALFAQEVVAAAATAQRVIASATRDLAGDQPPTPL